MMVQISVDLNVILFYRIAPHAVSTFVFVFMQTRFVRVVLFVFVYELMLECYDVNMFPSHRNISGVWIKPSSEFHPS